MEGKLKKRKKEKEGEKKEEFQWTVGHYEVI